MVAGLIWTAIVVVIVIIIIVVLLKLVFAVIAIGPAALEQQHLQPIFSGAPPLSIKPDYTMTYVSVGEIKPHI
jgi:hypothetical protein